MNWAADNCSSREVIIVFTPYRLAERLRRQRLPGREQHLDQNPQRHRPIRQRHEVEEKAAERQVDQHEEQPAVRPERPARACMRCRTSKASGAVTHADDDDRDVDVGLRAACALTTATRSGLQRQEHEHGDRQASSACAT